MQIISRYLILILINTIYFYNAIFTVKTNSICLNFDEFFTYRSLDLSF